jgi:hypothetical protein
LSVGEAALARIVPEIKEIRRAFKEAVETPTMTDVEGALELCSLLELPLAIVEYRKIARSDVNAVGADVGLLSHPIFIHPKPALRHLQRAIRGMIESEEI